MTPIEVLQARYEGNKRAIADELLAQAKSNETIGKAQRENSELKAAIEKLQETQP